MLENTGNKLGMIIVYNTLVTQLVIYVFALAGNK